MFAGICQAILPLALRRLHRKDDLQRACLLIETLAQHWRDRQPLQLLIVAPERDEHFIRARLPMLAGVNVTVRPESDFFAPFSRFFMLTGWFRQQIVKLYVPSKLGFAGYLTLDSDVVCVGDFDSMTFVRDGRALSRWEPKDHHDWWQRAARMAGVPYDAGAHGLSVTPNILHGDLATQALAHFHSGAVDAVTTLGCRGDPAARHDPVDGILALHQRRRAQRQPARLSRPLGPLLLLGNPACFGAVVRLASRRFRTAGTPVQGH